MPQGTKDKDKAAAFYACVKGKYSITILAECHIDLTRASFDSDKKIREDSYRKSKFPSKLIETGWAGK